MDASQLRLRRNVPSGGVLLPLHSAPSSSSLPTTSGIAEKSRKRLRKRTRLKVWCTLFLKGMCATIVSGSLSLMLLPFSWTQVDFHHQVQHEMQYLYHKLEQNRKNKATGIRGKHGSSRQVVCPNGVTGFENDDYCDCADGSDEPATSACSHLVIQQEMFACKSDPSKRIYASRVHDGVKDCPDGSDET